MTTSQYFGGRISGGAIGGFHTLEKYHEGVLTQEKANLIRNIAQDLKGVLNFSANFANEPIDKVVSVLKSKLPNPRNQSLSHATGVQVKVCEALAHSLNHRYGRKVIDTSAAPHIVCQQASELMNTLFSGLNNEFVGVASDVKRNLANIQLLRQSLESSFQKLYQNVQSGTDDMAKLQSFGIDHIYRDVLNEMDRQIAILSNIVGTTVDPTSRTIADLTADDTDFRGFVKSLKNELGTPDLSRKMTYVLSNISDVAVLANTVDRALKKIGMSAQDYVKYKTTPKLLEQMHEHFERHPGHTNNEMLNKFVAAVEIVRQNDYAHDDIIGYLGRKSATVHHSSKKGKKHGRGVGGAEGDNSLEKRLDRQQQTRTVLFRDFEQRLEQQYKQIASAIDVVAKRIGAPNGVPLDDHLHRFVRTMQDLGQGNGVDREKFYLALSGYQIDPASREERQRFLGQLGSVSNALKPLTSGPSGEHFSSIKQAVDRLVESVETFKDTYLKPLTSISTKPVGGSTYGGVDSDDDDVEVEGTKRAEAWNKGETYQGNLVDQDGAVFNSEKHENYREEKEAERYGELETVRPEGRTVKNIDAPMFEHDNNFDIRRGPNPKYQQPPADEDNKHDEPTDDADKKEDKVGQGYEIGGGSWISGGKKAKKQHVKKPDNVENLTEASEDLAIVEDAVEKVEEAVEVVEEKLRSAEQHIVHNIAASAGAEGNFVTLGQAIRHLLFFYNTAKVRHNLSIASKDIKGYAKDYETVLGDAVGDQVIKIKKAYEAFKKKYDDTAVSANGPVDPDATMLKTWIEKPTTANFNATLPQNQQLPKFADDYYPNDPQGFKSWRQSVKDNALKFQKAQMDVQIDLWKTAEAIDILLANFADAIASNPTEVKELNQLLKTVDIVAKWYTERSGTTIADFFESTPSALYNTDEVKNYNGVSYSKDEHYYNWVANLIRSDGTPANSQMPSNPFLGTLPGKADKDDEESVFDAMIEKAKKAALSVRVLDNLISTFAKLGSQYGSTNLNDKTFMPTGVIFKNLRRYMYHSSIVMGMHNPLADATNTVYTPFAGQQPQAESKVPTSSILPNPNANFTYVRGNAFVSGTDGIGAFNAPNPAPDTATATAALGVANPNYTDAERWVRARFCLAFSSIYDDNKKPINGYSNCWYETDQLFLMIIKSMVAKIFTVIGTYGVFNKPLDRYKSISNTRLILGGDFSVPEINPSAVELYIRLPLLAEHYREVFDFEGSNGKNSATIDTNGKKITMVPEFDGVWENFIRIVFEDAKYVSEGTYSENHVKMLIREINGIYNRYKTPGDKSSVTDVISAFVAEINRRYGVVKQSEIDKYIKDKRRYDVTSNQDYNDVERLEYNINDERDQIGRRPAPSDRFDHFMSSEERKTENPWSSTYVTLVRNFRNQLDTSIKRMMPANGKAPKVSFDATIRTYRHQVERAKSNEEKYKIILKAMQGVDQLNTVNHQKALMFHEVVLAPLNTLQSIWSVMFQLIRKIESMDLPKIEKIIKEATEVVGGPPKTFKYYFDLLQAKNMGYERYLHPGFEPQLPGNGVTAVLPSFRRSNYNDQQPGLMDRNILVYRGTYGAANDITWRNINTIVVGNNAANGHDQDTKEGNVQGIVRFIIDRETLFRDLVELSYNFGADLGDLTSVKIQSQNLILEYGQLAEYCSTLLDSVKKNVELFRGVLDESIISRVEGGDSKGVSPDPGSIYFIEENLIEAIFKDNRQDSKHPSTHHRHRSYPIGIIRANEILATSFKGLTRTWDVIGKLVDDPNPYFAGPHGSDLETPPTGILDKEWYEYEKTLLQDSYEQPMASLLYWSPLSHIGFAGNYRHGMMQPRVENTSVDNWPYAVIPAIERLGTEDDDIKALKAHETVMKDLIKEIKNVGGWGAGGANGANIFRYPPPLVNAAGAAAGPAGWADIDDNLGLETIPQNDQDWTNGNINGNNLDRVKKLADRYNALFKQRERIYQSSIRTPMDHRIKWYTDPSNPDEGSWFLHQLSPNEYENKDGTNHFEAGLLVRFNQILAKYLYNNWDRSTHKMYANIINKFANGTHTAAVSKGQAINDIDWALTLPAVGGQPAGNTLADNKTGILGTPASHAVIFSSLARAMRNILINTKRSGDPEFRIDSMTEVPIHMKETMRANLPGYDKLFKLVIRKTEFLRQIAQHVSLVRQLPYALKYGINRDSANRIVPNNVFATNAIAGRQHPDTVIEFDQGEEPFGHSYNANVAFNQIQPNQALLDAHDVMCTQNGMVIRNASTAILNAVNAEPVGPNNGKKWIRGLDAGAPEVFRQGDRFQIVFGNMARNTRADPVAYVNNGIYEDLDFAASKRWHTEIIDDIANAAISINKCVNETYKELADEPKYLETHEGFIGDYTVLNKYQPLMLLSQLQVSLRPRFHERNDDAQPNGGEWNKVTKSGYAAPNFMLPLYKSGESAAKLAYGSRLVLGRPDIKPDLQYMPGMSNLLDRYNGVSTSDSQIAKSEFEVSTIAHTVLLRYLTDLRHFRAVLDSHSGGRIYHELWRHTPTNPLYMGPSPAGCLFDAPQTIEQVQAPDVRRPTDRLEFAKSLHSYPAQSTLEEVLAITESSDQEDTMKLIVSALTNKDQTIDTRAEARIYNIIDMNIVPINIHALMREIPMINLINYSYTCDRMIQDTLMPDSEFSADKRGVLIDSAYVPSTTRGMLTKMLLYPYAQLSNQEYYGLLGRIVSGDSGMDLGRPKFISDQLWNKVLFQELYSNTPRIVHRKHRPDESGPAAESAQRRALMGLQQNPDKLLTIMEAQLQANAGLANIFNNRTAAGISIIINQVVQALVNANPLFGGFINAASALRNVTLRATIQGVADMIAAGRGAGAIANILATVPQFRNLKNITTNNNVTAADVTALGLTVVASTLIEQTLTKDNEPESFENNGRLQYPKLTDDGVEIDSVNFLDVPSNDTAVAVRHDLAIIGRMRFDTTFMRNMFFLVNIQRVMRMMMRDEVQYLESPVVNASSVISRQITDYESNETFDPEVFQH